MTLPVPAWTKRHPILKVHKHRLDWQAWLVAADQAEDNNQLEEAKLLRRSGEVFRAIVTAVQEALPRYAAVTIDTPWAKGLARRSLRVVILSLTEPIHVAARYDLVLLRTRPSYLPMRIVTEILTRVPTGALV